jgi:hypothetical protein
MPMGQNLAKNSRVDEHPDIKGSKMGQNCPDTNLQILAKSHLTSIEIIGVLLCHATNSGF